MIRILVVDDEQQLLRALRISLAARHYEVAVAQNGATALELAARHAPDLLVLDLGLPDMDGADVITAVRAWSQVPILVLSGRTDASDKVAALDAGADDYLTKPFNTDELLARIRAQLRRAEADTPPATAIGHYTVDLAAKTVHRTPDAPADAPAQVHLTKTEWAVLDILVRSPGRLVSGKQILQQIRGPAAETHANYLRFYITRLRQKLEPEPSHPRQLLTEPGMGYRFQPDTPREYTRVTVGRHADSRESHRLECRDRPSRPALAVGLQVYALDYQTPAKTRTAWQQCVSASA